VQCAHVPDQVDLPKQAVKPLIVPQLSVTKTEEAFQQLLARESHNPPLPHYLAMQPDMTILDREFIVDWMVRAAEQLRYDSSTVFLAVRLLDRMLSKFEVLRPQRQTLCAACIFIAGKFNESHSDRIALIKFAKKLGCRSDALESMEVVVLSAVKFHVSCVTAIDCLEVLLGSEAGVWTDVAPNPCQTAATWLSRYLLELTLQLDSMLVYRPSAVAAAVVLVARQHCIALSQRYGGLASSSLIAWPGSLQRITGFTSSQLHACCDEILEFWNDMFRRVELVRTGYYPFCDVAAIGRLYLCEKYSHLDKGAVCWVEPCTIASTSAA
jgi:hypothetical protein